MKLEMTEQELVDKLRYIIKYEISCASDTYEEELVSVLKSLGVEFKQEIDWEAETHDRSVIPENWLVEKWLNAHNKTRSLGFFNKDNNYAFENYRAIKKEDWPKWAIEQHKSLEG